MEDNERTQARPVRRTTEPTDPQQRRLDGAIERGKLMIEELEAIFNEAALVPLTRTRMVRADAFEDLVGQLRMTLPDMVREAAQVLAEREDILAAAKEDEQNRREEAARYDRELREAADAFDRQTRSDAEEFRAQMLTRAQQEGAAIVADAQTRARQIVEDAQQQARRLVEESEITRRAQAYAMELRDTANAEAGATLSRARQQTDLMLSGAAAALSRSAGELAQLRDSLLQGNAQGER